MKFNDQLLAKYKIHFDEYFEKQILDDCLVSECERCHYKDSAVLTKISVPYSPAGPGGDFDLCIYCTVATLEEAEIGLNEYYYQLTR